MLHGSALVTRHAKKGSLLSYGSRRAILGVRKVLNERRLHMGASCA